MEENILASIKAMLNLSPYETAFDGEIIPLINTYLMVVNQFGVGANNFLLVDGTETWRDFLGDTFEKLPATKTYVQLQVRLAFDPPDSSAVLNAMTETVKELAWRLTSQAEHAVPNQNSDSNPHHSDSGNTPVHSVNNSVLTINE